MSNNKPIILHIDESNHYDASDLHDQGRVLLHHFIEQLLPHGINHVEADFTGSDDSADDCTWNFNIMPTEPTDLINPTLVEVRISPEASGILDNFVWSFVDARHDGWENNAGGYGTVTFDLVARSCILDMNERYESSESLGETALFNDTPEPTIEPDPTTPGVMQVADDVFVPRSTPEMMKVVADALLNHGIDPAILKNAKFVGITREEAEALAVPITTASQTSRTYRFHATVGRVIDVWAHDETEATDLLRYEIPEGWGLMSFELEDDTTDEG